MGCLVFLMALIGPRFALAFVWITTNFVQRAFDGFFVPLLGLAVLPWTTLVYVLVYDGTGVSVLGWFFVLLGVAADIGSYSASARRGNEMRAA